MAGPVPAPPPTPAGDTVEVVHGHRVADPYRWLEDGDAPEVAAWDDAQTARTEGVLGDLPQRPPLHARLLDLLSAPVVTAAAVAGDVVFTVEGGGGRDQSVLTVRAAGGAEPEPSRLLVDPAALLGDGTAALDWFHPSPDGRRVAVGTSVAGDEKSTLRVLDVVSGELLADEIPHTRAASVAWVPDGSAFAYTRYPDPAAVGPDQAGYHRTIWWHSIGDHPGHDELVFGDLPDPTAWPDVHLSRDGRWLLVHVSLGWERVDVHLIDRSTGVRRPVIEGRDVATELRVVGDRLVGTTTLDAPRGRVVSAALADPSPAAWVDLVPEGDAVVELAVPSAGSVLVASTLDATARLQRLVLTSDGTAVARTEAVVLPEEGTLNALSGSRDRDEAWLTFTSFARPAGLLRWTKAGVRPWAARSSDPRGPAAPVADPDRFTVERWRYPSDDGTPVTLFTLRRADVTPSPHTPTILTGYGGFAVTMSPEYSATAVAHAEAGGVWALACLRGGREEGEAWHRAGMRAHKEQVFADMEAAADWLVAEGRTSPDRLAIRGGSNGGLLVTAVMTRRPEICRAVHAAVPLCDMVRYPRFRIARLWVPEFGDPAVPEELGWLLAYSPYHHVVDGTRYPATLVTTGADDSRVDPLHARKMVARLQAATSGHDEPPVLLRVERRAGHGQGKPIGRQADEAADVLAFLHAELGVEPLGDTPAR